jgi:hypothetical protein
MPVRKLGLLATLLALGLLSITSSASATTFLRTDPGNFLVSPGTLLSSSGGQVTLASGSGNMQCTASLAADTGANPGTPSVVIALTGFTLSPCVDTIPTLGFDDCRTAAPFPTVTATAAVGGGTVTLLNNYLRCHATGSGTPGLACYVYSASMTGSFVNASSTLSFTGVSTLGTTPPGATDSLGAVCPFAPSTMSMTLPTVHRARLDTVTTTFTVTTTGTITVPTTATTTVPTPRTVTHDTNLGKLTLTTS